MMDDIGIQIVQVRTDDFPRGDLQLWWAAVPRETAVASVLTVLPEGWTARLARTHLARSEADDLRFPIGTIRKFQD